MPGLAAFAGDGCLDSPDVEEHAPRGVWGGAGYGYEAVFCVPGDAIGVGVGDEAAATRNAGDSKGDAEGFR